MNDKRVRSNRHSVIKARVDEITRSRFRKVAQRSGQTESELLREIITIVIDQHKQKEPEVVIPNPNHAHPCQLTLRLPAFLLDAVRERTKALDVSASRWVVSLIQSNLIKIPVMTTEELRGLSHCTTELSAIGRNLNQVARVLNADFRETEKLKLELIKIIQSSIKETQQAIYTLARATNQRWEHL